MKRAYLIVSIALVLGGCEKEDGPVDPPDNTPAKGKITFYLTTADVGKINLPVVIMINDSIYEDRLNGASSGTPSCEQPSTLGRRVFLEPGSHSYLAYDKDSLWTQSGTIVSESDICKLQRLQ